MTSRATEAVQEFLSKSGHHDTTVHERVAPAVKHDVIEPTQHEDVQTVIDKEIHQDHYHTSVQPVQEKIIQPETHTHNLVAVEHRNIEHGSPKDIEARLAAEAGKFRDERVMTETEHTHSVAPVVAGEHIHHHVHETIQPVIQREIIQPTVVHTTVPIHEVHHNAAQHHTTSALPAVSMADFKKQGGTLTGREERYDGFEGEPKSVGGALSSSADQYGERGVSGTSETAAGMYGDPSGATGNRATVGDRLNPMVDTEKDATGTRRDVGSRTTAAPGTSAGIGMGSTSSSGETTGQKLRDAERDLTGQRNTAGTTGTSGSGYDSTSGSTGSKLQQAENAVSGNNRTTGTSGTSDPTDTTGSTQQAKPSLLDRLNPLKDTTGDGHAGFMK